MLYVFLRKVSDGHSRRRFLVLPGWGLHLVQVSYGALFILCLYSWRRGHWPKRSWARVMRLCLSRICSILCISEEGAFGMLFSDLFAKWRSVSVV